MTFKKVILLSVALFAYACNQSDDIGGNENTVVSRFEKGPNILSPLNGYSDRISNQIISLVFQSLLTVDYRDGQIKPLLAQDNPQLIVTDSSTIIQYQLRPEARWGDGTPVTAEDVLFTLKLIRLEGIPNELISPYFSFIREFRLGESAQQFKFHCEGYSSGMELASGDFYVLPKHLLDPEQVLDPYSLAEISSIPAEESASFSSFITNYLNNPEGFAGSGAYTIQTIEEGRRIALKRKENHWLNELSSSLPYLASYPEEINFLIIPDIAAALTALRNEELDVMDNIPGNAFKRLKSSEAVQEQFELYTPESHQFRYIGLNTRLSKLSDSNTRKALAFLTDVQSMIDILEEGYAKVATSIISPDNEKMHHAALKAYIFNQDSAKHYLQAAGWSFDDQGWSKIVEGQKQYLNLSLLYRSGNNIDEDIGIMLQQSLRQIGIPLSLKAVENKLMSDRLRNHDFELFVRSLTGNPFVFNFKGILHSESAQKGGANYTGFSTQESDSLVDAMVVASEAAALKAQLSRFQEIMHEEIPMIFLYFEQHRIAIHRRFDPYAISGINQGYQLQTFKLKEE